MNDFDQVEAPSPAPTTGGSIISEITDVIDNTLASLEEKLEEKDSNEITPKFMTAVIGWIRSLLKKGENVDDMPGDELTRRFNEYTDAGHIDLTPMQRNIFGWTNESIDFYENQNHRPANVPHIPRSILLGLHFGTFQQESGFDPEAVSGHRVPGDEGYENAAKGLGQFKPGTWASSIERNSDILIAGGMFTREELMDPNAITDNPRLGVFLTTGYILRSISSLIEDRLLVNGIHDPKLAWKVYMLHHHGTGDGPKHIRYHVAAGNPTEQARILATMRHPGNLGDPNDPNDHDTETAEVIDGWIDVFAGNQPTEQDPVA
jgi:hypothetical protein